MERIIPGDDIPISSSNKNNLKSKLYTNNNSTDEF